MTLPATFAALAAAIAALAAGVVPAAAKEPPVLASGDVTATTAMLWARAPRPGPARMEWSTTASFKRTVARTVSATPQDDLAVHVDAAGLEPATRYWYRLRVGTAKTQAATFTTAPPEGDARPLTFAWAGGTDAVQSRGHPGFGPFAALDQAARVKPAFFAYVGDTIDADSPNGRPARTLGAYRDRYRLNLRVPALQRLLRSTPLIAGWDDGELAPAFAAGDLPPKVRAAAVQAFHENMPVRPQTGRAIYRSFRWGRNLEIFVLDTRSYRAAGADRGGACDTPAGSRSADVAPRLSDLLRAQLAAALPQLATPVAPGCLSALDTPRTLLGDAQKRWFKAALARSKATWKVVLTPAPMADLRIAPYDRWEGYAAERHELLQFVLGRGVRNVVWLTTGAGATLVAPVTLGTPAGGAPTGMYEVAVGPVGSATLAGRVGAGAAGPLSSVLASLGASCVNLASYAYGRVQVTSTTLRVEPVGADGRPLCAGPLTLTASR